MSRLEMKITKSSGGVPRLSYTGRDDRHFLPTGLYIIKTVNGLYMCCTSFLWCNCKLPFYMLNRKLKKVQNFLNRLFSRHPSEPWTMAFSKNSKKKFFYNKLTKQSTYEMPPNSAAPFQYVSSFLFNDILLLLLLCQNSFVTGGWSWEGR